jgi:hypothetical protein
MLSDARRTPISEILKCGGKKKIQYLCINGRSVCSLHIKCMKKEGKIAYSRCSQYSLQLFTFGE